MRRYLRPIFLWMLILTLPVQGLAGALKSSCAMESNSTGHFQAASERCHDGVAAMASASVHAHEALSLGANTQCHPQHCGGDENQKHSSCSACSSCCIGACAPPSFGPVVPTIALFNHLYFLTSYPFTGFIPARLERPPRAHWLA
jgi:hypothetical protein